MTNAHSPSPFAAIEDIVADMRAGKMVILVDDEGRENEGDVIIAAEHVTPAAINFMARHCRGLICLTLTAERCDQLGLPPMVSANGTKHGTAFTVSIEAATGVDTGISAADRARTVQAAVAPNAQASDLVSPGHIFPLRAAPGGVLMRAGHTEAGCDLAAMAGLLPASVICEIMNEDGTMARVPDLIEYAHTHGLKLGTIADLIRYRTESEQLVTELGRRNVSNAHGTFELRTFSDRFGGLHLAMVLGQWTEEDSVLVRVHEPLSVVDFLDDGEGHSWGMSASQARIHAEGRGVILMLNVTQSEEAIKAAATGGPAPTPSHATDHGLRTHGVGAQLLRQLGVRRMRIMGRERRYPSMGGFDLSIDGFVTPENA